MKVYILDNGILEFDANCLVNFTTRATSVNKTPVHKWIKIPIYAVLIDHPQAKILYDTGCASNSMEGKWPEYHTIENTYTFTEDQRFDNQLQKAGFKPEDIDIVVMSHMHLDHAGNLDMFKHADVYVHKEDFANGLVVTHKSPDPNTYGGYIRADLEVPCNFKLVEDEFELVPGVQILNLPGHSPGVLGLMVHLKNSGTLIFPSDALYSRENYGPPPRISGIFYDSINFFKTIEKIRKLEKKYDAQVMFSHDIGFFQTMKLTPGYYD